MTSIALFHSVLGIREGVEDAARRLRNAGHAVTVVDQYEGVSFDDYEAAAAFAGEIGFPELMRRALEGVAELPDGFAPMGFSNGGGMATFVALHRLVSRVVLCSGALPLDLIGADRWPDGVLAQIHYGIDDPFKTTNWVESVMHSVNDAGSVVEYLQYPTAGHLFTDQTRTDEYSEVACEQLWSHVLRFLQE